MKLKEIYLDYAAAAPLDPQVKKAMDPFLGPSFGNPSSLHKKGVEAREAVELSRESIAKILSARAEEIVFTSGGTESCNLALLGLTRKYAESGAEKRRNKPLHVITTSIEHHAVLEPCKQLEREGYGVTYLKVDREGFVKVEDVKKAISPETVLVSVMYANNEIGTIEPIREIGKLIQDINKSRIKDKGLRILFHTDACQAPGFLDLNVNRLGVDLMSVNGSKIYGPKQTGFLFVRNGVNLKPIVFGGGQEKNLRSGTENVAGIVGLAKALELVQKNREIENKRISDLRDYFVKRVLKEVKDVKLNGPGLLHATRYTLHAMSRLPNNINLSFKGLEGEALMLYLDAHGIYVSTASACSTGSTERSHVIESIGIKEPWGSGTIRITLGKFTQKKDLDYTLKTIKKLAPLLRRVEKLWLSRKT